MRHKLRKLRRTSFDELYVRGSQALAAFAERRGWSQHVRMISDEAFLSQLTSGGERFQSAADFRDDFSKRISPRFFAAFDDREQTVNIFRKRWPSSTAALVERANRITQGYFDLLGLRQVSFGIPIDWHLEPIAGKRAPLIHWSQINYLDSEAFGDKKIIWELNRHQYFATLGQAYWLTGDERYAETIVSHVDSWINENPPKLGINWASSLEVAFRSISWIWALYFLRDSPCLAPELFVRVSKFLYLHARHLETFLSTYFSPNTHLTGEALGLFYLGTFLPELKHSARWRALGLRILLEQLDRHVRPDGVYFEQSSYYHRYTTDFYLHLAILLDANGEMMPRKLSEKLLLLLDHLMYITRPDGTTPLFGDDDGGRVMRLDQSLENDFRSTLATGAAFFNRPDYKFVSGGPKEESFWLLGPRALKDLDDLTATEPEHTSMAFPVGGYYVMRDGWDAESNYLLFDCGPHGVSNCGHAHADALSFELAAKGQTLLVDPGTYTYTSSQELRDWFRGSSAHNTVTVDEQPSSVPAGPFTWKTTAQSACSNWIRTQIFDYVEGSHNGYKRLPEPAIHLRSILFLKKNYCVIYDRIQSLGDHEVSAHFHFDSGVAPLQRHGNVVRVMKDAGAPVSLQVALFANNGDWRKETGWVSHCYARRQPEPAFVFSTVAKGSHELITFLLPETLGSKSLVREIEAIQGCAFEINIGGHHDVLMIRDFDTTSWIETVRIASDFKLTWARFANERSRTPDQLVLIEGKALAFEGRDLLRSTKTVNYLAASRIDDRFRVETEEGVLDLTLPVADLESLLAELSH